MARAIVYALDSFPAVPIETRIAGSYGTAQETLLTFVPDVAVVDGSAMSIDYRFDLV